MPIIFNFVVFLKPYSLLVGRYFNLSSILNYTLNSDGPLSMLGGCEGLALIKSKYAPTTDDDWPDLGIIFLAGTAASVPS